MKYIQQLKLQYKSNPFLRFGIHALLLYGIWVFAYHNWGIQRGGFDDKMTEMVGGTAAYFAEKMGYESQSEVGPSMRDDNISVQVKAATRYYLYLNGARSVSIGNSCNGLFITVLYIGFIIAYPGKVKYKLIYILLGTFIIFISNTIRILALALNWNHHRESFDFNHTYTYVILVYSIVFFLWMRWANKHSITAKQTT